MFIGLSSLLFVQVIAALSQLADVWASGHFVHGPFMDHALKFGTGLYMYNPNKKLYPDTLMPKLGYDDVGRFYELRTHVEEGIEVIHGPCRQHGIAVRRSDVRPDLPEAPSAEEATKNRNVVLLNGFHTYASIQKKEERTPGLKFTALTSDVLTSSPYSHVPKSEILATSDQFKWAQDDVESFWWQMRPGNVAGVVALLSSVDCC